MLIRASATHIPLADESVQVCCTSPPYWGLRKYSGEQEMVWGGLDGCGHEWGDEQIIGRSGVHDGDMKRVAEPMPGASHGSFCRLCGAWKGGYGLEPTIDLYVQHTVEILREIRRVLRKDGTVFWNVGDSYASGKGTCFNPGGGENSLGKVRKEAGVHPLDRGNASELYAQGLKPKDLCLIPFRVALAAQADGWFVRSVIVWAKGISFCPAYSGSVMPESVTDRPTTSHEYVFLLTKSANYYWDAEAVRERGAYPAGTLAAKGSAERAAAAGVNARPCEYAEYSGTRNLRTVWAINPEAFPDAHFATYPTALVRPMILAATSEKGACPKCGKCWERVVGKIPTGETQKVPDGWDTGEGAHGSIHREGRSPGDNGIPIMVNRTLGWRPGCECYGLRIIEDYPTKRREESDAEYEARVDVWRKEWERLKFYYDFYYDLEGAELCRVLDPFVGSGTTVKVAEELGRVGIGLDLSAEYLEMAKRRIDGKVAWQDVETVGDAEQRTLFSADAACARSVAPREVRT